MVREGELGVKSEHENVESPLKNLIVDEEKISEEVLYETLKDFVKLTKEGRVILTDKGLDLPVWKKVMLVLLAKAALYRLGMAKDYTLSPKEISDILGENSNTIRPILTTKLSQMGLITSPKRGRWTINWTRLNEIKEVLRQ